MELPPANLPGAGFGQTPGNVPAATASGLNSDFETFLKMLTVQMKNQDPLNPVESADFAVQLATFSTVEQQVLTNDLLTALGQQIGALSVAQLSDWVGMEARAEMPVVFDGAPVTMSTRVSSLADAAQLVIADSHGNELQRHDVSTTGDEIDWAGTTDDGSPLPAATYTITVESFAAGERIATHPVEVHSRIIEARNENGQPILVMESGQQVPASQILGLRDPAA